LLKLSFKLKLEYSKVKTEYFEFTPKVKCVSVVCATQYFLTSFWHCTASTHVILYRDYPTHIGLPQLFVK